MKTLQTISSKPTRSTWREPLLDQNYVSGLAFLAVSVAVFAFSENTEMSKGVFFFNFLSVFVHGFFLFVKGQMRAFWRKQPVEYQAHRLLFWSSWVVSCFSLNRSVPIFQDSVSGLSMAVCGSVILLISYRWESHFRGWQRKVFYALWAISAALWLYFSVYLAWLYPIGSIGITLLGIGFHAFVPLILVFKHGQILYHARLQHREAILTGFVVTLAAVGYFVNAYYQGVLRINQTTNRAIVSKSDDLPVWVQIAQRTGNDWITERVLKSEAVYQTAKENWDFMPNFNFEEVRKHDPLVVVASWLAPKFNLAEEERIKILESRFDARHNAQERFWSGRNLAVSNAVSQVQIYPDYRLAYTEKTLTIQNKSGNEWQQEEAIFTFYLPEGAAATSLSLWIGGQEKKAILTTQAKADSAYRTVVGVESRDPSLVHWAEGNTVKVRVFPCTSKEPRRFKIGITSPLVLKNKQLEYQNIYFKGPSTANAHESIRVDFTKSVENLRTEQLQPQQIDAQKMIIEGNYHSDWSLQFDAPAVNSKGFSFGGKNYVAEAYQKQYEKISFQNVYLDLNKAWDVADYEAVCTVLKAKKVWVWADKWTLLTSQNKKEVWEKLGQQQFSLFPVHRVPQANEALLITKSAASSPNLKELEGSNFVADLKKNAHKRASLCTFCLESALSVYLKTLVELRLIRPENGNLSELVELINQNKFPKNVETNQTVLIEPAHLLIRETATKTASQAPDHLLRLFAYNHVLQQIGNHYFEKEYATKTLIDEAARANVVTPVSSLIVLETQADYNRFNIKKSQNSLKNATLKQSGAVPEPQEWILISLFAVVVGWYWWKSKGL